jgi:GGDEF domain-containing protein
MADKIIDARVSKEEIESSQNFIRESVELANKHLGDVIDKKPGIFGWFSKGKHKLSGEGGKEILEVYEDSMKYRDILTDLPNREAFDLGLKSSKSHLPTKRTEMRLLHI